MAPPRIHLVRADLETCVALLGLAEAQIGVEDFKDAGATLADLEQGCEVIQSFLATTSDLKAEHRAELTLKLEGLSAHLNRLKNKF